MELIILVVTLSAFFISFVFPRAVLCMAILMLPFYKVIGSLNVSEAQITAFEGLTLALFIVSLLKAPLLLRQNKLNFLDLIVVLWSVSNAIPFLFFREDFIYGINIFRNFVAIPVMLYLVIRLYITDLKILKRFLFVLIIATSIMALLGIREFIITHQRIETVLDAGHAGSILMAIGFFSGIFLYRDTKHRLIKTILILSIVFNFIGIVLVFGRVMIPSVILMPILLSFLLKRQRALILIFTVCFLVAGFSTPLNVKIYDEGVKAYDRMRNKGLDPKKAERLADMDQTKAALGVRTIPYLISLDYIGKHPIFGYGYSIHKHLTDKEKFPLAHSHNIGLDILLRTGFFGLLAFIVIIFLFVKQIATERKKIKDALQKTGLLFFLSLVFIIISNGFANSIPNLATSSSLWLCIGLAVSISNIKIFKETNLTPVKLKK